MMNLAHLLLALVLASIAISARGQVVASDGDVAMTEEEFRAVLETLPPDIREKAANDTGDRFELLNQLLMARKLAHEADQINRDDPAYWPLQFKLMQVKKDLRFDQLLEQELAIDEAALLELARERYATLKDRYAKVPETRSSSHVLLASPPGLDRTELREQARNLLQQLREGASFAEYVEKYSEDPGSKQRAGSLGRWIRLGEKDITPPYSEALFEIDAVGGYSEVTDSPFGLHIIRLDGIRPSRYLEFDEVKDTIVRAILNERRQLAVREVRARYLLGDNAFIDGAAMERLFAPYK
jgi:parvulin-like peptidyl-prolyl isomerase